MLPGILLTGVLVWRAFANNRAASERRLVESARVDAAALDCEFAGAISILEALATSPTLDRNDLEAFHAEGRRVQATQPGWYTVLLTSRDGTQLLSTRRSWGAPLRPAVEPESLRHPFETGRPTVGMIRQPPDGGPEHLFAIRVPVLRDGALKFALSAVVNVESLARVVPRQLANSDEWTRSIQDPEGTIAVRTRGAENYIGSPASEAFRERIRRAPETIAKQTTREGLSVYAATSRSTYGWTTVVVVPSATLDGPLVASTTATLAGGALLMMCGLAAVLFVSRRLTADLTAATRAAAAVAKGQSVVQADGHVAETRRLQPSLASAASLLENRAHERDEQIRRTEAARAEAERANQTKDQFLAVLGHELRNPARASPDGARADAGARSRGLHTRTRSPRASDRSHDAARERPDGRVAPRAGKGRNRSCGRHGATACRSEAPHTAGVGAGARARYQRRHRSYRAGAHESGNKCGEIHAAGRPEAARSPSNRSRAVLVEDNIDARDMLRDARGRRTRRSNRRDRHEWLRARAAAPAVEHRDSTHRADWLWAVTDGDAARSAGFDAHCAKPVSTAALRGLIDGGSEHEARA